MTTIRKRRLRLATEALEPRMLLAITATIDYSLDTNDFFNTAAKKNLLQSAADEIVSRFEDDLNAITPSGSNTWSAVLFHPGDGSSHSVNNLNVAANELIIYAGGRNDLGATLGFGGPGGFSGGGTASWLANLERRGEAGASGNSPTDFGPWGGAVTFNTTTNWHFGATTSGLDSGESDFYSVALHELAHLFGFGTAPSFDNYVSGSLFTGPDSVDAYDSSGNVPLHGDAGHWANGTTDGGVEAAMDPSLLTGTRKELTILDLAGLSDVGWEIDLSGPPQSKLVASDFGASDWFGYSVDIDGDYAVVGAPLHDDGGNAAGAAYLFKFDGSNWVEEKQLTASDAAPVDQFGWSVAIDGSTVVVGAYLEDSTPGKNAGSAYVFQRNFGGTDNWGEVTKLVGSGTSPADKFGVSVDIGGNHIIVGAHNDDPVGSASGAAYIFSRNLGGTNNWGEVAALTGSNSSASDLFGWSVAIDGNKAVVGSRFGDTTVANSGAAYLFVQNVGGTNNWGEVKRLQASDASTDQFGYSVAVSGDTIAVGSRLNDDGGSNTGSAYLYNRTTGGANNWGQVKKVVASDPAPGAWFGNSIALDGEDLVVGSVFARTSGVKVGAAYHLARDQGGTNNWGHVAKIVADDAANNDRFGIDVGISGSRVVAGAYLEDPNSTVAAGSTYVSLINPGGSSLVANPIALAADASDSNDDEYRTLRVEPGGCGCGGQGCVACVPSAEYDAASNVSIPQIAGESTRFVDRSESPMTDTVFARLSKRLRETSSRRFATVHDNLLTEDIDWLDVADALS